VQGLKYLLLYRSGDQECNALVFILYIQTSQRFLITTVHNPPKPRTMTTKSFPPVSDLITLIGKVDWSHVGNVAVEGINEFLAIIEQIVMFIAALATVLYGKWEQHSVTSKIINAVKVSYTWISQVALPQTIQAWAWIRAIGYPEARKMIQNTYNQVQSTYQAVSDIYSLVTARQFVNL
jgi:hypothetical protein